MNREDKQRAIGKIVAINSDKFTVELLGGIDNFNVNGYDDIHYFAQLNSYVIIPYQNYYLVAEVCGVREKDLNVPFNNPAEQLLNKVRAGKYLEVIPIGTLRINDNQNINFEFGVSVYPALYTDVLYIKETELDAIFNVNDKEYIVCSCDDAISQCDCSFKRYGTLSIGKSTIFPDYDIKIDIDKFFGSHSAILGNTGSGKSCTISSMIQEIFRRYKNYSATGSTFIFFDVNGEYKQAFSEIANENTDIKVINYAIGESVVKGDKEFILPHWFLTIEEWALLLQASEKTQLPILRNALGIASVFESEAEVDEIKNHILATCITQILRDDSSTPSKKDRIISILQKFHTPEINLANKFNYINEKGKTETYTIEGSLHIHFGEMIYIKALFSFLEQKNSEDEFVFISDKFKMPTYDGPNKFQFESLEDCIDLALLYEEAHGNRQIRDYCSSLLTRTKSIQDRVDFNFLKNNVSTTLAKYKRSFLGLKKKNDEAIKEKQIVIIDLSSVEDEIVEIVSCVLARILYESLKELKERNTYPVNLILEEAHRYIGDDPRRIFLKANRIFEQIAKEGRKFGMFLIISSQRPSELSRTVLSQCSNFIVHRIQNPEDLSHIRQITPHISEAVLRRMPSIPTQHALIFGHAVNLPAMFKVNNANPRPKSDNNKISENWFRPKDFAAYRIGSGAMQEQDTGLQ